MKRQSPNGPLFERPRVTLGLHHAGPNVASEEKTKVVGGLRGHCGVRCATGRRSSE